ncbi:hypothetical protein [Candidatus Methylacidithermus pantelleriae]|uniref:Uncharacterized protein n=1 Tax=Candidatus Methylacidithermus pantelleriae TaxID=2744239 RepID=A0A8J2BQ02_9BACT|nr:hypothetical protein [Candidatus Methylacidithermus pantelleriae]CAF0702451.1 hypothetical protein MPNT_50079 [Candidatus Methylacidithermus pantelleriae]
MAGRLFLWRSRVAGHLCEYRIGDPWLTGIARRHASLRRNGLKALLAGLSLIQEELTGEGTCLERWAKDS